MEKKCCNQCQGQQFNSNIFPAPYKSSYLFNDQKPQIHWKIDTFKNKIGYQVPYSQTKGFIQDKCIMFFHGNGYDIGQDFDMLSQISSQTGYTIYQIQYPSYGCYKTQENIHISDKIKTDSIQFFNFLIKQKKYKKQNIIIFGFSIGSGPACHLACQLNPQTVILLAPFSSITQWFSQKFGNIYKTQKIKQHFDNLLSISKYKGKLLIIHGIIDKVVQHKHGVALFQKCKKNNNNCVMVSPEKLGHWPMFLKRDVIQPLKKFLQQKQK